MRRVRIWMAAGLLAASCACGRTLPSDGSVDIVPVPVRVTPVEGVFRLGASTPVCIESSDERMRWVADALDEVLQPVFGRGLECRFPQAGEPHAVNFLLDASMAPDAYRLTVTTERVDICAGAPEGAFYAVQTLRQLLPVEAFDGGVLTVELPAVEIEDRPAMAYRGLMLDVARHFFTVDEVKRTLDLLALHKMNVFHWHLTDDQGWRIEIKKYPDLARKGSVRKETLVGNLRTSTEYDGIPYREIAETTGVPVPTLLSRKHYAIGLLRKRLQQLYREIVPR